MTHTILLIPVLLYSIAFGPWPIMHGWLHASYALLYTEQRCVRGASGARAVLHGMHRIALAAFLQPTLRASHGTGGTGSAWLRCVALLHAAWRAARAARAYRTRVGGQRAAAAAGAAAAADDDGAPSPKRSPWQTLATSCAGPALLGADTLRGSAAAPAPPTLLLSAPGSAIKVSFSALAACMIAWPGCANLGTALCCSRRAHAVAEGEGYEELLSIVRRRTQTLTYTYGSSTCV
eukprot:COSAG01_NODE_467_length_16597_cov_10.933446_12_plen_235_part_00